MFCCDLMLTYWLRHSKDVSVDALIKAIDASHVGLEKSKISSIKDILMSSCLNNSKDDTKDIVKPPGVDDQLLVDMEANFCSELSKSGPVFNAVTFIRCRGIEEDLTRNIVDFVSLVKFLKQYSVKYGENSDIYYLGWLKAVAKHYNCSKAQDIINKYEQSAHLNGTLVTENLNCH